MNRFRQWTEQWATSSHADVALFLLAGAEAIFFPIPPEILLVAILLVNANRWWWEALVATIGSVFGAIVGYTIGALFYVTIGVKIVAFYGLESSVAKISKLFAKHDFITIFIAAFTPIPFKVITISAGLFGASVASLILASLLGRGIRYSIIAVVFHIFGERINGLVFRYFNIATVIIVGLVIASLLVLGSLV